MAKAKEKEAVESLRLHHVRPPRGSHRARIRKGRGPGSGIGKTAGRGGKGQTARTGGQTRPGFEGGQMPLIRRIPKRGFTNPFRQPAQGVNVRHLAKLADGGEVTPETLFGAGLGRRPDRPGTLFSLYDLFAGGGFSRATVFALGIMPYISASIVFQLAGPVFPVIEKMQRDEEGRKRLTQWTRYLTVLLCLFQSYGFAIFTEQLPGAVATFSGVAWLKRFAEYFSVTSPWYVLSSAVLIVFFAYFYTSIIFNPVDLAENLKKQGGFIPGVKPGAATADYIEDVLTRITLPGALFLTVVAMLPIVVSNVLNMPFGFGGTALLIVVGVALDTVQQVQQHLLLRHYDGFMKEGRVKFRGRQRYM